MEEYKVLAISTSHLSKEDTSVFHSLSHHHLDAYDHPFRHMVMARDTGWFIKLYDEADYNDLVTYPQAIGEGMRFSPALHKIIMFAHSNGYRMIEFDRDAEEYPNLFETYDW